jgi:predicted DNA-binding transcriptional regulator YafY
MIDSPRGRRRASIQITRPRASRLYALVRLLEERPRTRDEILRAQEISLRTFYRELDLLKRCGIKILHKDKLYTLASPTGSAEGLLPFPDPQLSFAEMADLARCECEAGRRLASLLASVVDPTGRRSGRASRPRKR